MALDITAQDLIIDETSGLQDDDTATSNSTVTYLLSLDAAGGLSSPQVAYQSNFVVASASAGENISSVTLTQSIGGAAFSTTDGVNSGIRTVDGNYVWLFQDASHSNIVIGVIGTSDPNAEPAETGALAFSFALVGASATNYDLYTVQYVPLLHPDATNPNDQIDLAGEVFASVSGTTTVGFNGDNAPPGINQFYCLNSPADATKQILVTGFLGSANATPNVSTQGFGVNNQSINPTEKLQVDFVTGGTLAAGSGSQINYTSHIETIMQAGFTINQITPSSPDKRVDITITASNVQGNEQGLGFYDGSPTLGAPIMSVTLTGQSGVSGAITVDGTYNVAGNVDVVVSGLGTSIVTITGLDNVTTVDITTSSTFDRLTITGVDANEGCDITEFHYSSTTPNSYTEDVGTFINFNDDGPSLTAVNFVGHVDEDALTGAGGGDLSVGIIDNPADADGIAGEQDEITFNQSDLGVTVNSGSDAPAIFSLNLSLSNGSAVTTSTGSNVFSKGDQVLWRVSGGQIQGVVNAGLGSERIVFVISVNTNGNANPADDVFTFDLRDQLDHSAGAGELANLLLDITPAFRATDADLDPVNFGTARPIRVQVENDTPTFTAQIQDGTVQFANNSSGVVTNSLNGAVGADDNNASSQSSSGVLQYTFVNNSWTEPHSVFADLDGVLSSDGATITFYSSSSVHDSTTAVYEITLNQTANSGAGSYTFTVLKPPVISNINFDFTDLPAGQNLFGVIAVDKADLTKGGLLVMPNNPDINDPGDGSMTNLSGTVNTSKGGGPVTIGNGNQAFDHLNEGAFFCYVDNPLATSVGGLGLTQTTADDADFVDFNGTNEVTKASVEIVQASGGGTVKRPGPSLEIFAWDINPGLINTDAASRAFLLDPSLGGTQSNIIGCKIINSAGATVEYRLNDLAGDTNGGHLATGSVDAVVGIQFILIAGGGTPGDLTDDIYSVQVSNLRAGYTIEFETEEGHDLALVENRSGSFDIGGFNVASSTNVPAQDFDFQVQVRDYDNDIFSSSLSDFSVHVDGIIF